MKRMVEQDEKIGHKSPGGAGWKDSRGREKIGLEGQVRRDGIDGR